MPSNRPKAAPVKAGRELPIGSFDWGFSAWCTLDFTLREYGLSWTITLWNFAARFTPTSVVCRAQDKGPTLAEIAETLIKHLGDDLPADSPWREV